MRFHHASSALARIQQAGTSAIAQSRAAFRATMTGGKHVIAGIQNMGDQTQRELRQPGQPLTVTPFKGASYSGPAELSKLGLSMMAYTRAKANSDLLARRQQQADDYRNMQMQNIQSEIAHRGDLSAQGQERVDETRRSHEVIEGQRTDAQRFREKEFARTAGQRDENIRLRKNELDLARQRVEIARRNGDEAALGRAAADAEKRVKDLLANAVGGHEHQLGQLRADALGNDSDKAQKALSTLGINNTDNVQPTQLQRMVDDALKQERDSFSREQETEIRNTPEIKSLFDSIHSAFSAVGEQPSTGFTPTSPPAATGKGPLHPATAAIQGFKPGGAPAAPAPSTPAPQPTPAQPATPAPAKPGGF